MGDGGRVNFEDFVRRFDEGEVDEAHIDALLEILYPDDLNARAEHRGRVVREGQLVKFQAVGLNKRAEAAWQAQRVAEVAKASAPPEPITDLPPEFEADIPDEVYEHEDYVPQIKSRVGIVQAVRTWGKPQTRIKDNRTEGVKVRCPFSHHVDNRPSAWVNTAKNTWYCGKCMVGGDVIDFYAAAKYDLEPSAFHRDKQFGQIVGEMADELGIRIVSTADGGFTVEADTSSWASNATDTDDFETVDRPAEEPVTVVEQTDDGPVSYETFYEPAVPPSDEASEPITITEEEILRGLEVELDIDDDDEPLFDERNLPSYDWRELDIPENTFLHSWMTQAEEELDWIPYEFFLALGFQAISIACNHTTTTRTFGLPLTASSLYVIVGDSASGKSTACARLADLLHRATGAKFDRSTGNGVKQITSVASAEALTQRIKTEIIDINDPTMTPYEVPTNAWYLEDELAQFISRSRRQGGEHIKQRVMRFHDFTKKSDQPEIAAEDFSATNGYKVVHDSFFTGTFLTQNDALRTLASREDLVSGFFNRMNFWMGVPRNRRLISKVVAQDPDPDYIKKFERMWKDCNLKKRVIPFSDAAFELIDNHPLNGKMEAWTRVSPMFSRWQITMLRIAFMLAVNENAPLVDVQHVNAAYRIVAEYLVPCGASMVEYVKSPEKGAKDEFVEEMTTWANRYFDKHGAWPQAKDMKSTRWWRGASLEVQNRAQQLAESNGYIVRVTLIDGPDGSERTYAVVPTGDFSVFHESNGKKYKYDDFYDGRRVR